MAPRTPVPRVLYNRARLQRTALLIAAAWSLLHCGGADPVEDARALQAAGRFQEAVAVLAPLLDQQSRDPEVLYLYGANQRRSGHPDLGMWALHQASLIEGWEVTAGLEFAAAARQSRDFEVAIEAATRVLEVEPDNLDGLLLRAEARLDGRSDYEEALADFERALEVDPSNISVRVLHAATLLLLERVDEAAELIAQLEDLSKEENFSLAQVAGFCVAKATFARETDNLEEADAAFADCLERHPDQPTVLNTAIDHYDEQGRPEEGNALLAALIEEEPLLFTQRARLARRLRQLGQVEQARALLDAGTEVEHPVAAAYSWSVIADILIEEKRFSEAAEAFGKARELEGDFGPQRVLAHAELLALAGENERAMELAEELGDHFYKDLVHARVKMNKRKPAEALVHLERVLVQWPNNAQVHYYAGRAAERLGDWSRALDAYRSSIRSGAGATDAGVKLARLNLALGKYRDAFVAAGHHVNEHGPEPEAVLLALEASTRLSRPEFNVSLSKVREGEFGEVGVLLARVANELRGAEAAVAQLHDIERLDLENPRDVAALDALAHYLVEAGRVGEARERVDAMLAQHPDLARLHLIRSRLSSGEAATRALERAFELDAELEMVAVAMAMRRAEKGEVDAGVALIEPFVKSNPLRLIDIADLLARAGRNQEAEARLEDLLWERPHHSEAATRLVALRLSRGAGQEPRTLELAERAVKFLGGAPAYQALADVHDARGDAEKAKEARDKASTSS